MTSSDNVFLVGSMLFAGISVKILHTAYYVADTRIIYSMAISFNRVFNFGTNRVSLHSLFACIKLCLCYPY